MTSLHASIQAEIQRESTAGREVVRVRVTPHALAGSPVCMPVQSTRFLIGAKPEKRSELLLHPDDYADLLELMEGIAGEGIVALRRAFGLPVAQDA